MGDLNYEVFSAYVVLVKTFDIPLVTEPVTLFDMQMLCKYLKQQTFQVSLSQYHSFLALLFGISNAGRRNQENKHKEMEISKCCYTVPSLSCNL